jgi:ribonucleoside-diphosphate reductase alpha chain
MLDNAYDVTIWPTETVKYTNQRLRKIGLGIMGAHHFLIKRGIKYSDMHKAGQALAEVMKFITINAYWESVELAKEKGQFEALDREKFLESGFTRKLPRKLRDNIKEFGIRNCSLTSIAPTGTIAIAAHTSPGLEPCVAKAMKRNFNYRWEGNEQIYDTCNVIDPIWLEIYNTDKAPLFEEAADISLENHLYIQAAVQPWVDSSVSKTVNFRPGSIKKDDVKRLIKKYFQRLKGFTMLPEGSRKDAPQQPVPEKVWRKWIDSNDFTTYGQTQKCQGNQCDI